MNRIARRRMRSALVTVAAALAAACSSDLPSGLEGGGVRGGADVPKTLTIGAQSAAPEANACPELVIDANVKLVVRAFAQGVQVYQWNGASWSFVAPSATLYADAELHGQIATHFGGPTWQSNAGGTVVGTVSGRCTPDATAVPWLLLTAKAEGPGLFSRVAFIQRVKTVGGIAPSAPGTVVGEQVQVPYTAQYLFYRLK